MKRLDTSSNNRIPVLMELMNSMSRFTSPRELLEAFIEAMRRAYGSRCYVQVSTRGLEAGEYRLNQLRANDDTERTNGRLAWNSALWPVYRGGVIADVVAGGKPVILQDLDLAGDPALGQKMSRYRSIVATPLFENEMGMNWVVLLDPEPHAFDDEDLEEMILRANLVGAMVNNLEIARKLAAAHERIQREIDAIGRIQRALLPTELPEMPGLRLAASYRTFDRAGGDFYDVGQLGERMESWRAENENRWVLLIGDVSGHGPAAAVVMAMFNAILHAYPVRPEGPAEVLTHINRHLCAKRIEQSYVTAFLAFYDPATRELTYARAGHNPPVLKMFPHQGPPVRLEAVGELPLSIFHDVQYTQATVKLEPGQTLIMYTDGITEARSGKGDLFGVEGIEDALRACTGAPECAIRHINERLIAYQGDVRPGDDQTILAIQVMNEAKAGR